ncbi:hypothetical protein F53441_1320 [Fusarium austroafricanum]|uniref:Casein kinase substrate phosphoprotein PP28 domain-containing protein n=1 Tax=Fusarium austroafricanum TaxID=2364996 RepID=A0A8H4KTR2_9HYPO|nr:hypothetical protein F53441_1320 [Fusarium austroafricanum]
MAPGGPPGGSARGRGGKFRKPARGGGKKFSRDIRPVDADGNEVSMWADINPNEKDDDGSDEEESSEDSSSEEEEDSDEPDAGPSQAPTTQEQSREDRKAEKKARKEAAIAKQKAKNVEVGDMPSSDDDESESDEDGDMPANPNHSKKARKQAANSGVDDITEGVDNMKAASSRREREALEAAAAKERHMRLTAQGKTDESKADLERLKAIREQRALDAARRQAEREEKEEQERIKKAEFEAKEARRREAAAGKKGKKK